ncbi:MAG: MerR family transcriptional regulator [Verrucomicrobia bacterium]|nr:MerR family transcriptional regulator [Verrucomicrobiota bacterium]
MNLLRRWEKTGKIQSEKTHNGRRRYDRNEIIGLFL